MSDYQGKTYYLEGSPYTVEKTIAEGKIEYNKINNPPCDVLGVIKLL